MCSKVSFCDPSFSVVILQCALCVNSLTQHLVQQWSELGDYCNQNFNLGRYIVGYTIRNLVLHRCASGAVKHDFRLYIHRYNSPNENFEYSYPHSNAFLQSHLKLECCKLHKTVCHQRKCDVINDVKLFLTVYF